MSQAGGRRSPRQRRRDSSREDGGCKLNVRPVEQARSLPSSPQLEGGGQSGLIRAGLCQQPPPREWRGVQSRDSEGRANARLAPKGGVWGEGLISRQ